MPTFVTLDYGPVVFTVAHGLGRKPHGVILQSQAAGKPWFDAVPFDDVNVNLIAPDLSVTVHAPDDLSDLQMWLGADAIGGLSDGEPVALWSDQSGEGNDATQSTPSLQPTYKTGIINGKPVVRCAGDWLEVDSLLFPSTWTVLAVVSNSSNIGANMLLNRGNSASNNPWACRLAWDGNQFESLLRDDALNKASAKSPTAYTGVQEFTAKRDGDLTEIRRNGIFLADDSATLGAMTTDRTRIGHGIRDFTLYYGDIAELVVYDRVLTDSERDGVENYLCTKYGIPTPLNTSSSVGKLLVW